MSNYSRVYTDVWNNWDLACEHCFSEAGKTQGKLLSATELVHIVDGGCPARIYGIHSRFDIVDYYCMAKYFNQGTRDG